MRKNNKTYVSLPIMTRSATKGWRALCAAALGIGTGTLVHIVAAAVGLSAVLATSATAFTLVKYAGAPYILYMAIGLLRSKPRAGAGAAAVPENRRAGIPALAVFTAHASARIKLNPLLSLWLNRVTGGLFIWLGIKLALAKQH